MNRSGLQRPLRWLPSCVGCEKCPPRESGCVVVLSEGVALMWGARYAHRVNRSGLQRALKGLPSRGGCQKCPPRESGCVVVLSEGVVLMWGVRNAHRVNRSVLQRPLRWLPSRVGYKKCPPRESVCRGQRLSRVFRVMSVISGITPMRAGKMVSPRPGLTYRYC